MNCLIQPSPFKYPVISCSRYVSRELHSKQLDHSVGYNFTFLTSHGMNLLINRCQGLTKFQRSPQDTILKKLGESVQETEQ